MADQPKRKKSTGDRNDSRANGKASKRGGRGAKPVRLTYLQKTLMGGGAMVVAREMSRRIAADHPDRPRKGANA